MMNDNNSRKLKTLHSVICIGILLLLIILHFIIHQIEFDNFVLTSGLLTWIGMGTGIITLGLSSFLFQKNTTKVSSLNPAEENDTVMRNAYILKWALLEAGILTNALLYFFITYNSFNITMAISLLLVLFVNKPN